MRQLPSLTALRAFDAAARCGSVRGAAAELNVTHSAVSHQIAELERELGVTLFERRGRSIHLSEAGRLYHPLLRDALDQIARASQMVRRLASPADLTIHAYVTFAMQWLIPHLHDFQQTHPKFRVRVSTSRAGWDFDPSQADLGIVHLRDAPSADLETEKLFTAELIAVCHPKMVGHLKTPAALLRQTILRVYSAEADWQGWLDAAGLRLEPATRVAEFDNYLLALEAAAEGQGVAIAPSHYAAPYLRQQRLVAPFKLRIPQPGDWAVIFDRRRRAEAGITACRDWLLQAIASDPTFQ